MVPIVILIAAAAIQSNPGQNNPGQNNSAGILIDRGRIDRAKPPVSAPARAPAKPRTVIAAKGVGTPITGIAFEGAKAPAAVAEAARGFLGKPASEKNLQLLAAALSAAYGESDVALYTVAIPEQDFGGGTVTVLLTEGRIAKVDVAGPAGQHALLRRRLVPLLAEAPLSRVTFERQIVLAQAIPGLTFDTDFKDPEASGALALTVTPKQKRRKASIGFSNRGVDLLGDGQFDAKADFYGLGTDGDLLSLNASAATDFERFRYGSAAYTAPLSASGLSLSASGAYLETRPKGFDIIGRAKLAGVSIAYPLVRGFKRSADLSLGLDGLNSDNAAFGNLIATERTRAVRAAASYAADGRRRGFSVSGSVSKGVDILGAWVMLPLAEATFLKGNVAATIVQQIGTRTVARVSVSGQYSRDRLPAAERFAVGGEGSGRAFDTSLLSGDRGAGGSAELAFRPVKATAFANSEVYGFVDGGTVGVLDRGFGQRLDYSLASTGVGVRARYKEKAELGLEAARAINDPYPGYGEDWRLSVAWRLTL